LAFLLHPQQDADDVRDVLAQAYQVYNANKDGYGHNVIENTKYYEPNPTSKIFNAGGQQ
jgi:hypothetical protein